MNIKELDKKTISVVLENMGMLYYDVNKDNWEFNGVGSIDDGMES